jgi:hypothetical protein
VWTQRWTGNDIDPVWTQDMVDYLSFLRAGLARVRAGLWINAKNNHNDVAGALRVMRTADVVLRESQWLHACQTGTSNTELVEGGRPLQNWYAEMQVMNALWDKVPLVSFNYLCGHPVASATDPEIAYATANYYLTRGQRTYFQMQNGTSGVGTPDAGTLATYPASVAVNLGMPIEPPPTAGTPNSGGGCYKRSYQYGLVVVWPESTGSCTYTVPGVYAFKDQFGNSVSAGAHTLSPDSSVTPARPNAIVIYRDP